MGQEDAIKVNIPLHCGKMAFIAGPIVALVETTFALTTETVSTIHAKTSAGDTAKKSFGDVLKETITPKYMGRCFNSLCVKNFMANTSLFWVMFMSDFYTKRHNLLHAK